jgi:hypothetical protein
MEAPSDQCCISSLFQKKPSSARGTSVEGRGVQALKVYQPGVVCTLDISIGVIRYSSAWRLHARWEHNVDTLQED